MKSDTENFEYALFKSARDAKGGITACAEYVGVRRTDFAGRVGRSDPTRKPNIEDMVGVIEYSKDTTALEILCEIFGGSFNTRAHSDSESLLHAVIHAASESGDLIKVFEKCDKDKNWSQEEKIMLRREISDVRKALSGVEDKLNEI